MKIRLVLAITFILFSITSGIEVFGMKENDFDDSSQYELENKKKNDYFKLLDENNDKNIENEVHEKKELNECNYPSSSININMKNEDDKNENNINTYNNNYSNINNNVNKINNYNYYPAPPLIINSEPINYNISEPINNNIYNVPQEENSPKLIRITQPFGKDKANKNILFFYFFKKVECIYEGNLGITLFEILSSFGMSILNNIIEFEKMDKNKFYANMFLLKFGFKLGIPILSFIIVDFNICIYNWLVSGIKYLMFFYNKAPLEQLGIKWEAKSFDKNFKFICLFNAFNIDIKLNLFGLSLCIPLTKILEALLICKLIQDVGYKKKKYAARKEMGEIYNAIYDAVETETRKAKGIMNRITKASEEGLKILEEISTQAREILPFPKKVNNNNPNNNNIVINNIHNNNIINVNNNHEDNNNIAAEENIIINNNLEENNIDEDNNINNEENNNIPEDNNIDEEDNNNNNEEK